MWNAADAAALVALGLHALQHRGQEASGIVSLDETGIFHSHKGQGLVGDNFSDPKVMNALRGRAALGHNRYATTGETALRNVQPLYADFAFGGFAVAHNGNLTNAHGLRREPGAGAAACSRAPRIPRCSSTSSPSASTPPWRTG